MPETFGQWLTRKRGDLSQDALARLANCKGVSQTSLSRWETDQGDMQPSAGQFAALAEALGLTETDREEGLALARSRTGMPATRHD